MMEKLKEETIQFPVVPMSCETQENLGVLMEAVVGMSEKVMGKGVYKLVWPSHEHNERYRWLIKNAGLT